MTGLAGSWRDNSDGSTYRFTPAAQDLTVDCTDASGGSACYSARRIQQGVFQFVIPGNKTITWPIRAIRWRSSRLLPVGRNPSDPNHFNLSGRWLDDAPGIASAVGSVTRDGRLKLVTTADNSVSLLESEPLNSGPDPGVTPVCSSPLF